MRKLNLLFTALLLLCCLTATAHDFEKDGIYYNILSEKDKTVEVTFKGDNSYSYNNEYIGDVVIPATVTKASSTTTTVVSTYDAWTSTNKNNGTTSQTSYSLNVEAGYVLKFDWSVSSENNYDWLLITLDGTEIVKKSGTQSGSYEKTFYTTGTHSLVVKYTKDNSQSSGNDECKIYNITLKTTTSGSAYHVTSIRSYAFQGCSGLTSVVIPNSVTSIGENAFYNCFGLTSIEIPNSVTSIGDEAFNGCSGLTSIEIPNSVTSIGWYAFQGCTGLTSIEIPNSVTSIGSGAFYGCTGLKEVHISNLANWCNIEFEYGYANPLHYARNLYLNGKLVTELVIPSSISSIKGYTFVLCEKLTSVVIPNNITNIHPRAFDFCAGITNIIVEEGNPVYDSRNNCNAIIRTETNTLVRGCKNTLIPNSITYIGDFAFGGCYSLTDIEIPNSVTNIGNCAFADCDGMTDIEIPDNVTSIGNEAFAYCNNLTNVVIGNGLTTIERSAFYGCTGLTSVVIPNSVTSIGDYAFRDCTGLTSIEIPSSVTSIGNEAFYNCTGLTSITSLIPADALFTVYSHSFYNVDKNVCTLYVPVGAKSTYASTAGWSEFTNIVELEPTATEVTITIDQHGCGTQCLPYALDFSNIEGLKAYSAIGFNSSTQVVTLASVMTTPAGAGIFVKGEPGEYVVPVIERCNDHTLNLLVGTLTQTTVNSTSGEMSNYMFTFDENCNAPMFCPFENNTTFAAGKAYLQIPTAWLPLTAQRSLNIRFEESEMTDIDEVYDELKDENGEGKTIYDLQGSVVENPTSGIYIIDGKKVLIK